MSFSPRASGNRFLWSGRAYRWLTSALEPLASAGLRLAAGKVHDRERRERLCLGPLEGVDTWWHAASLGEQTALEPILDLARAKELAGRFVVTTTSRSGRRRAEERWPGHASLAPLDLPRVVERALEGRRPRSWILVETELWPNWLMGAHRRGVRVGVVNGRISDRSWPRYRRWAGALRVPLDGVEAVAARTEQDAERFIFLGARAEAVAVTGNLKHDRARARMPIRTPWAGNPVWTAGSLRPGEETVILDAYAALGPGHPDLRLAIAPRHPEAWPELEERLRQRGLRVALRSQPKEEDARADVWLVDTHGELPALYAASAVAFVGGTLVTVGGHNVMEAAAAGVPVLLGPHHANVVEDAGLLLAAGGARIVRTVEDVVMAMDAWLVDAALRGAAGEAARGLAERSRGAAARTLDWLLGRSVLGAIDG